MSDEIPPDPGSPRARFGAEMRRLREAAQLSQAAVGRRLGCTQTQVSRLESAARTPSKSDAQRLDVLFGSDGSSYFTDLHEHIVARHGAPIWFMSWAQEVEPFALVMRSWEPLLIPGFLQTEAYAREIFKHAPRITPEEIEERVKGRMWRKKILEGDNPPLFLTLVDESVLRRNVGGPGVMREQLSYLLEMAQRPSISVQLVDRLCLSGVLGAFMIAELPDGQPDAIYADSSAEGQISADPSVVTLIWNRYEAIRGWAYPERMSLKMIEEARREWI